MSDEGLLTLGSAGEHGQRARAQIEALGPRFSVAIRRALPFLGRKGGSVTLVATEVCRTTKLYESVERPVFAQSFVTLPSDDQGAVVLDRGAVGIVLDGTLGGDGTEPPPLLPNLSPAQTALVGRSMQGILSALSEVTTAAFGMRLAAVGATLRDAEVETAPLVSTFEMRCGEAIGRLLLAVPRHASFDSSQVQAADEAPDGSVKSTMDDVEIELVAELGRMPMSLARLIALAVGDTLPLNVPVGDNVRVRAGERLLFLGVPTTSAGRIAIRVVGHEG
jgi:flagellar motor switch protein FliM